MSRPILILAQERDTCEEESECEKTEKVCQEHIGLVDVPATFLLGIWPGWPYVCSCNIRGIFLGWNIIISVWWVLSHFSVCHSSMSISRWPPPSQILSADGKILGGAGARFRLFTLTELHSGRLLETFEVRLGKKKKRFRKTQIKLALRTETKGNLN